jgi:hypothetical protein
MVSKLKVRIHRYPSALASLLLVCAITPVAVLSQDVGLSHIGANVPAEKDFRRFLIRDLESYFVTSLGKPVRVDHELLRDAPTQSGVSYPKYYAWVKISDGNKLISEGAVRVAAIDRVRFEVTDYLSKDDIRRDTQAVEKVFPKALSDSIRNRAGVKP